MIHNGARPEPPRRRPARSGAARRRIAGTSVQLALTALFAHLLVSVHAVSHVSEPTANGTTQHCVICMIGDHPAEVSTALVTGWQRSAAWRIPRAGAPVPPQTASRESTLARAPPRAAHAFVG